MIIGHQRIIEYFRQCLVKDNLAHAYLFSGPEALGKKKLAFSLARALECKGGTDLTEECSCDVCQKITKQQYPDFSLLDFDKSEITKDGINHIRQLIRRLSRSTYQSQYKIGIIDNAEMMNKESANALLKTLEEPPAKSLLILLAHQPQLLLPTIVSRCQEINFLPVSSLEIAKGLKMLYHNKRPGSIKEASQLAFGRPGLAINYLAMPTKAKAMADLNKLIKADLAERFLYIKNKVEQKSDLKNILNQWIVSLRAILLSKQQYAFSPLADLNTNDFKRYSSQRLIEIIKDIEQTQEILTNTGLNHRLALENLMLVF